MRNSRVIGVVLAVAPVFGVVALVVVPRLGCRRTEVEPPSLEILELAISRIEDEY